MGVRGWGKNKIARTCCDCCDVGESAGRLCGVELEVFHPEVFVK